jgi:hypothetical protein
MHFSDHCAQLHTYMVLLYYTIYGTAGCCCTAPVRSGENLFNYSSNAYYIQQLGKKFNLAIEFLGNILLYCDRRV